MKEKIKARIEQELKEHEKEHTYGGCTKNCPFDKFCTYLISKDSNDVCEKTYLFIKLSEAYEEIETLKEKDKMNDYNFYRDDRGEWQRYDN